MLNLKIIEFPDLLWRGQNKEHVNIKGLVLEKVQAFTADNLKIYSLQFTSALTKLILEYILYQNITEIILV